MTDIEWRDDTLPVSRRFDDPYFSREDGRAETDHVFIKGNNLAERWPAMRSCTIAELGFGTGLNFLETVRQWQNCSPDNAELTFISFEQFPLIPNDIEKALGQWPELAHLSDKLLRIWKSLKNPDTLKTVFTQNIHLEVHFGDANALLPNLDFKADAWFLDGFSPAKNPELWNQELMQQVGRNTVVGGTVSTYTSAGFVRRNLQDSGFDIRKTKGFGTKREMVCGTRIGDIDVADGY